MNEYLAKFRADYPQYADMPDAALLRALHKRFYSDMTFEAFTTKVAEAGPVNTGPTEQPPFATLPPMVGGALDALVAFGNYAGLGIPSLVSRDTREAVRELKARSPGGTMAAGIAGGAALGVASAPLFAARTAATGPYSVALGANTPQAIPSIAGAAAQRVVSPAVRAAGQLIRNRWAQGAGLLGLYEAGRRALQ